MRLGLSAGDSVSFSKTITETDLVLFAGIRERFAISRIPKSLEGTALGLVTAGLMALAFWGFTGMVKG